ncbi:MAG: tRNA (guanosine(37)-N1)-methyltransferase TrmD [Methylocystaceae bacterium]
MKFLVLTLFPNLIEQATGYSIVGRAREQGLVDINAVNIRDFALDRHRTVDDYPYGGGAGMVMKADIAGAAIEEAKRRLPRARVVYMSPQGPTFNQDRARALAQEDEIILLCGHYEGMDERVLARVDEELSIGDYVLTGGELPALAVIDAITRLLPGALGDECSPHDESFVSGLLEYPQYTRPAEVDDQLVPEVLTSGHHENVRRWRLQQSLLRTLLKRPDLLLNRNFSREEKELLQEILFKDRES